MSDSDASGANEQDESGKKPGVESRPVSAAARRERRASARPAGKSEARPGSTRPSGKAGDKVAKPADTKGTPTPKRDRKPKKASVFARLMRFVREVWAELRKVIWPNRKQMVTYTAVVLVFVVFMVALVSGLDFGFKALVGLVFG
ncbi:preprotein translocase subunit SecE [Amycolatopsis jejuensis]|uniref:preprotein translocase subunit SecE n=1 Tax=Amycolatopsis jejuensis TaxID=330084 RepID=UPI000AAE1A16|nr:preprotein translocase subunit SecE [Amycolatopsis jejuensis]